jgi:limonene 1,2-monooxygenase
MPVFQPSQRRLLAAQEWARSRHTELDAKNGAAIQAAADRYAQEKSGG